MDDIVTRLRAVYISVADENGYDDDGYTPEICEEAADFIEELRGALKAARDAISGDWYLERQFSEPEFSTTELAMQIDAVLADKPEPRRT